MRLHEFATIKPKPPLTPEQARIEGLKQTADRAKDALKNERNRQKVTTAQQRLQKLTT
jgi:hypothetical protein